MLYLIKLAGKDQILLKIGYTKDLEQRIKTYKTHNPLIELIDTQSGEIKDETILHNQLLNYSFEGSNEWFVENEEIYNVWNSYKSLNKKEDENLNLYMKIFKRIFEVVKLINPKQQKYIRAYLGEVSGYPKNTFFKYFIKDMFNINLQEYKQILSILEESNYLIPIGENLYILHPVGIEFVSKQ